MLGCSAIRCDKPYEETGQGHYMLRCRAEVSAGAQDVVVYEFTVREYGTVVRC